MLLRTRLVEVPAVRARMIAEGSRQDDLIALVDRALDTLKGDFTL
ncbi:hypothetical protein [Streptomyces spiramyceticus]|nr:hypothetical protein [Streptomyces spiramyceticus]